MSTTIYAMTMTVTLYMVCRVGQYRIYAPYMPVYLVISLPKIPYIHRICMVLANPNGMRWPLRYVYDIMYDPIYDAMPMLTIRMRFQPQTLRYKQNHHSME
jgi:hypothetical protein